MTQGLPSKGAGRKPRPPAADRQAGQLLIEYLPVDELQPYPKNAREHPPRQVSEIAESIKAFGFVNPAIIDESGGIIAGHGRIMAAKQIGLAVVPCIRLAGLNEIEKRALIIADNRIALNASWDVDMLAQELGDLHSDGVDLSLVGFSKGDLDRLLGDIDPGDPLEGLGPAGTKLTAHTCPACGHEWTSSDEE